MDDATFPQHGEVERWLPVVGYEDLYAVSSLGRVYTTRRQGSPGGLLKPKLSTHGYLQVSLYRNGEESPRAVHRLVLEAFVGPCPPGMECRHGENGKLDNRASQLCWGTKSDNCGPDKIRDDVINWGERNGMAKLTEGDITEIRHLYATGETQKSIGQRYGVAGGAIGKIVRNQRWTHVEGAIEPRDPGPRPAGEEHWGAKLTRPIVDECKRRFAAGETQTALAREFGVSISAMHLAVRGKNWRTPA